MKIVKNVVVPTTLATGKNTLTSLLTANSTKLAGRRILMTKAPDGSTRVITGAANIAPKGIQNSVVKVQTGTAGQIQLQPQGEFYIFYKFHLY